MCLPEYENSSSSIAYSAARIQVADEISQTSNQDPHFITFTAGFGNFQEEIGFFPEEWKKLEKRCFFQFLPEESGRNWKKVEETGNMLSNVNANKVLERSSQIL